MTAQEKRSEALRLMKSILKKNTYSQNASKREKVFDTPGYGDCSSTVRKVLGKVLGYSIGSNTVNQINNTNKRPCVKVDANIKNGIPDERKLMPCDCLYFAGNDKSRSYAKYVGHVEMYVGNNTLCGHGSGKGPTTKKMKAYCKSRQNAKASTPRGNKGLICVLRWIPEDDAQPSTSSPQLKVTGGSVNIREGPGTNYQSIGVAGKGELLASVDADGWRPVLVDGEVRWISEKYVNEVT